MNRECVYIMVNPSFRNNIVKIGKTYREVDTRAIELDTTSIPMPFEVYAYLETEKYDIVEKILHKIFDKERIRDSREFFAVSPEKALEELKLVSKLIDNCKLVICNGDIEDNNSDSSIVCNDKSNSITYGGGKLKYMAIMKSKEMGISFEDSMKNVLDELNKMRLDGLSVREIARKTGISPASIQRYTKSVYYENLENIEEAKARAFCECSCTNEER